MEYRFSHIGLNHKSQEEAKDSAAFLENLFNASIRQGHGYLFADETIELRESWFKGKYGHIAYSVKNIEDAIIDINSKGVEVDYETAVKNNNGEIVSIYLNIELAGFAIHLVKER